MNVFSYEDIPFAKTPRFQKPEDYGKWEGTWNGQQITRRQPQGKGFDDPKMESMVRFFPMMKNQMERAKGSPNPDCEESLHCSVYTSDLNSKKPVMVWIHGGGWGIGSASEYNGVPIVAIGDVVVVCLSYRLGSIGFFLGNWGLFDMVKGLQWVQDNIHHFGGDKNNVTIFGESAGGWSIDALMCSSKATGLFHRGIAQSGCLRSTMSKYVTVEDNPMWEYLKKKFEIEENDKIEKKLREMSSNELADLGEEMDNAQVNFKVRIPLETITWKSIL